jgi:hypothetical protein
MDHQVAEILTQSRVNNQKNNLVGALYYANRVFFQCLEGEESAIDQLLEKLRRDSRHQDLKVLRREVIQTRRFQDWEMKFAMMDREIREFLHQHHLGKFDPYHFTPEMTEALVNVLLAAQDVDSAEVEFAAGHRSPPVERVYRHPVFMLTAGSLAVAAAVGIFAL